MADWTGDDSLAAQAEGWDVFLAEGSEQNADGDRPYQLQRDDELGLFQGDHQAWAFVALKAASGSELHKRALAFLEEHSPAEHTAIKEWINQ